MSREVYVLFSFLFCARAHPPARTLPLRRFDPDKPRLLMGTMRLAIKYEVDGIRDVILRSVEED